MAASASARCSDQEGVCHVQTRTHLGCCIPTGSNARVLQAEALQGHGGPKSCILGRGCGGGA
jgi:hypothetical protein